MSDQIEMPDVYCHIVGINKQASGSVLVLNCKHQVPALPYQNHRFGDKVICHRCSAKAMAIHLAKKVVDDDSE
jgi:hypothetical protein